MSSDQKQCRMPVDHITATLKPVSFFRANPGMDVPGTQDNLSVVAQQESSCH